MTIIEVPAPADWINANARLHWAKKAQLTKAWRSATALAAAGLPRFEGHVRITATIHKTHGRQYDAANWAPTAKAAVDGLRDAGVLKDDSNKYVTGPDMRAGVKSERPRLVLTIEET